MSDNRNPKWREWLTVAAQIAGIIACLAAVTTAGVIVQSRPAQPPTTTNIVR
jgi:hypothetical protein